MSDEEESIFMSNAVKQFLLRKRRAKRRYVAHPINKRRFDLGEFHHLYTDLRKDPCKFFEYMRMTPETFDYILLKIQEKFNIQWCNCHSRPIRCEERLMVTLRYLSTGLSFRSLAFSFRMGTTTVSKIVQEILELIWETLQPLHMKVPTMQDFQNIADDYYKLWNFPNCIGTIDGKHIRILCPPHSGTMFYNYKQFYSIVLQGLVDANYKFINIDVGGYGKQSDGGTFRNSALYLQLIDGQLNIPDPTNLPNSEIRVPYVFLGDEAYPLLLNLLKPYGRQTLDADKEYFNLRLSRARRTVECAFGILYAKWRILGKAIETDINLADTIVKAICALHNVIIDKEGIEHHVQDRTMFPREHILRADNGRSADAAKHNRDLFKTNLCLNPLYSQI